MNPRELILLSPYQFPGQHSSMIGSDEVGDFLNGYAALWHPAALRGAAGPPRIASPYDYEQPAAGHLYAVPDNPPTYQPEDWDFRVRDAGAASFRAVADREATLANLFEALRTLGENGATLDAGAALVDLPPERVRPFFGLGLGFAVVSALFEAMEHENVLAAADFWQEVQAAVQAAADPDPQAAGRHLQAAAERLLAARQVLYPVDIHLLDFWLLDPQRLGDAWPAAFERGISGNLIASASLLEELGRQQPERLAALRERVAAEQVEVCGGSYLEREDPLLPVESQLWNLLKGLAVSRDLLGSDVRVFARRRFGFHPQLPLLLGNVGLSRALLLVFDDGGLPAFQATVVNWPSPDGRQVEGFTRTPYAAQDPATFFHLAHYLHKTIMQDHAATLALLHREGPAAPGYDDWLELTRLAPVLGRWTTLTRYFNEVMAGEQAQAASPDEFHIDYLSERSDRGVRHPVSAFARHARRRRHLDTTWTLTAIQRVLAGANDPHRPDARLAQLEDQVEQRIAAPLFAPTADEPAPAADDEALERALREIQTEVAQALAERLLSRAPENAPGYLVLNPCSFARRVALELDGGGDPLPIAGPVRACQVDGRRLCLVVEVPALGFAWVPRSGPAGTPAMTSRMRLADARHVRNEFFEAEIDPATGGLRGLWDHRTRVNRIGQQLVFNPGSTMRATEVKVTSTGPALGEVVSEGALVGDQNQVLATYRQRYRAWLGRPILELRVEIYPELGAAGYAWHSYYGARFAWRDERALLLRGVNGTGYVTSHNRPQTPDYLELRLARQNTVLFPGGLPFQQRHGARMLDVILVPPGETVNTFDLALGLDRESPMQTAWGIVSPVVVLPVTKGPPHVGDKGWLFHLDSPNLLLTSFRPAPDGADAIVARMLECGIHSGPAELRCARNPRRAVLLDARGEVVREADTREDSATFEVASNDWVQLRVEFS